MNILFITYNKLPDLDAGALRDITFIKLLEETKNKITCIHMSDPKNSNNMVISDSYTRFKSLKKISTSKFSKLQNYITYSSRLMKMISEIDVDRNIDLIWVVDIPTLAFESVKKYSIKNKKKLIHDSVEWYSPQQFKFGKLAPSYIMKDYLNKHIIDNNFKVVCISSYLENHFKAKGIETITIPIIKDINLIDYNINSFNMNKLVITYAGTPGKKDYLHIILKGLCSLASDSFNKIEFRIIGVTKDYFKHNKEFTTKEIELLEKNVKFFGRITNKEVMRNLNESDFTVLLRSQKLRYAKAGFPTKVVESMAAGTPVITNLTSDLEKYIIHKENGIIVLGESSVEFRDSLIEILTLTENEIINLKLNARKVAETKFNSKFFISSLKQFIDN